VINPNLAGIGIVTLSAILMMIFALIHRRSPFSFRIIQAFTRIQRAARLAVEDGTRIHFSLGNGNLLTLSGASALAGLVLIRRLSEITSFGDRPSMVTTGNPIINILAQDTLRTSHDNSATDNTFKMSDVQFTGLTPISYVAGAMPVMSEDNITSHVLIGHFGPEVGLLTDVGERKNASVIAASDSLTAQAVMYASSSEILIGEELFAAGAYTQPSSYHASSLLVQDILRWVTIAALLAGAVLKLAGIL